MKIIFVTALLLTLSLIPAGQAYAEETASSPSALTTEEQQQYRQQEMNSKYQEMIVRFREFKQRHEELLTRLERHKEHHYPVIEGQYVYPTPYLTLPFRKTDTNGQYDITEGWIYSEFEQSVHGFEAHNGIDFALPYGTPIVAPADGYAMSSYHTFWLRNDDGSIRTYQGKPLRFGLGYFVQMYIPSVNRYIQMAHMSDIDPAVPFSLPIANEGDWVPTNHTLAVPDLKNSPQYVQVKKGDVLGKVGYSGLAWGYEDYSSGSARPVAIDPATQKSWDEPHIHFEDFWRDQTAGQKLANRDPYGIYSTYQDYPTPSRKGTPMINPLFLRGYYFTLPRFADQ